MKKIPVNIISGFLGSGKTTAIINLLNQKTDDEQWAVIINEFGKIAIDSQTLRSETDYQHVFDISGGCICCSAKGYLQEDLEKIVQSGQYSRIIIEPSGLGGIDMVSEIIESISVLILMPVICLVDIHGMDNPRQQMNPIYQRQIAKSDVIVFTKCDLVTDKTREQKLKQKFDILFPDKIKSDKVFLTSLQNTTNCSKNFSLNFRLCKAENKDPSDHHYARKIFKFKVFNIFDTEKLARILHQYPEILRAKGYIRTEKGFKLMNYTLSGCNFESSAFVDQNEIVLITEHVAADYFQKLESSILSAITEIEH